MWLLVVGVLLGLPAVAQDRPAPSPGTDDIVVVGNRQARDKQIEEFIRTLTPTAGADALARFDGAAVCPKAVGLGDAFDKAVTERMRRIATAANIRLAQDTCRYPNALVVFADDKDAMIARLGKRYPWLFLDGRGEQIAMPKGSGPATAWHIRGMVGAYGQAIGGSSGSTPVLATTTPGSRLSVPVRPVFLMSVVIIRRDSVAGLTVTQVADYAAMRSFSDADPAKARGAGAPTILTVIETPMGGETPLSLTRWDLSFLRGLYAATPDRNAAAQRGEIGDYMKRGFDGKSRKK
jgi:hypothetical protein